MRTIPAGEFKAKCLAIMDEVQAGGEPVIVTKRGKPVVRISALETKQKAESVFGFMRGVGVIGGDIVGPIFSEEEWDHLKDPAEPVLEK